MRGLPPTVLSVEKPVCPFWGMFVAEMELEELRSAHDLGLVWGLAFWAG